MGGECSRPPPTDLLFTVIFVIFATVSVKWFPLAKELCCCGAGLSFGTDGNAWSSSADASCPPTVSMVTDRPRLLMKPSLWKYSMAGDEKPACIGEK